MTVTPSASGRYSQVMVEPFPTLVRSGRANARPDLLAAFLGACRFAACLLTDEPQAPEILLGPAGARKDLPDSLWAKGIVEIVIDKQHSASIRVLIDVMRTSGFSSPEALVLDCPDPVAGSEIAQRRDLHIRARCQA